MRAVGGHYISKDIEGKIVVWQAMDGEVCFMSLFCNHHALVLVSVPTRHTRHVQVVRTIRVPDCRLNARSRFDVSEDGEFVCAGNSAGVVFIYELNEGKLIAKLQTGRTKHPANGCVFSRTCQFVHPPLFVLERVSRPNKSDAIPSQACGAGVRRAVHLPLVAAR